MTRSVLALLAVAALAACNAPSGLEVDQAWARDTVGGTASAAVFMTITSPAADRLVGASTPVASNTDLMTMTDGSAAMEMIYVETIDIPAGEPVSLNPRGLHVWLADLKQPLVAGRTFPLTLTFENAGQRHLEVSIIAPAAPTPGSEMTM